MKKTINKMKIDLETVKEKAKEKNLTATAMYYEYGRLKVWTNEYIVPLDFEDDILGNKKL